MLQWFSSSTQSGEASVSPKHQDTAKHKLGSGTKCDPTSSHIMFRKSYHIMGGSRQEKERSFSSLCHVLAWSDSGSLQLTTLSFFLLCQLFLKRDTQVCLGRESAMGVPTSCSAQSLWGGHLGTAVAGVATKEAANSRQTELSSSLSAFNYPEGVRRICTALFNFVILSTVNKYS